MSLVTHLHARQILDSRGNPTLEVEVLTEEGHIGRASVPSGASTGSHEAYELRDHNSDYFFGKSVLKAIDNIDQYIAPKFEDNVDVTDQVLLDDYLNELDGTPNKSTLGANAILGVSMACAKAASLEVGLPLYRYLGGSYACTLPVPLINVINGGMHASNLLDFQEFMIVPFGFTTFRDSLRAGVEIFHHLKTVLTQKKLSTSVGDEGGFAPNLKHNEQALELLCRAVEKSNYKLGVQIGFALDIAANSFYKHGKYKLSTDSKQISSDDLISLYEKLYSKYPILSIEDGLDENDWNGWIELTKTLGSKMQLVGDDIFVTNPELLKKGIESHVANSILIKLNQIGTVTETLKTVELAKSHKYKTIISHRSGETEDTFIADLAVATNSGQIKTGSVSRGERTAKYNQLLRIEEDLGASALFSNAFQSHPAA